MYIYAYKGSSLFIFPGGGVMRTLALAPLQDCTYAVRICIKKFYGLAFEAFYPLRARFPEIYREDRDRNNDARFSVYL